MQEMIRAEPRDLPILTIVTVVFNGKNLIDKTIESVITQDYPKIEYIIIDGSSTDGTSDIIRQYEERLSIFISEPDEGIYDAMNKAIKRASGEFIIFLNCGDVFASTKAISIAMSGIRLGTDQIIFCHWLRQASNNLLLHCRPMLEKGLFNHQAVIYSRHIHTWHGDYVNVKGFTTADYFFFATLFNSTAVTCRIIETTLVIIDVTGLSSGPQTLRQKFAIDFICGRVSKIHLIMVLIFHPVYRLAKTLLGRGR
jgi:glycosyltransferase involved in cell wall biosynthesis